MLTFKNFLGHPSVKAGISKLSILDGIKGQKYMPAASSLGANWFRYKVSIQHTFRVLLAPPLEGAGGYMYVYTISI